MEENFSDNKNIIYAPTILFAWEELRNVLNSKIFIPNHKNSNFKLLNDSKTFQNSLNKNEYDISVNNNLGIEISAYFKKLLPFAKEYHKIDEMKFKKSIVKGFGISYYEDYLENQTKIIYYKDNSDFIVKLLPKDINNEIILIKTNQKYKSFEEVLRSLIEKEKLGIENAKSSKSLWKSQFTSDDELEIPKFSFNIGKDFSEFSGV